MGKKGKKKSKPKPSTGDGGDHEHRQPQQRSMISIEQHQQRTMIHLNGINLNRYMSATPDGAACCFCLDEGPDETGKPVVRDCSCRGNDAGYAHLSCMIKYAEQKSKSLVGKHDFQEPWYKCLSCKQPFKAQLALEMTSAFISFTESTYGLPRQSLNGKMYVMPSNTVPENAIVSTPPSSTINRVNATDTGSVTTMSALSFEDAKAPVKRSAMKSTEETAVKSTGSSDSRHRQSYNDKLCVMYALRLRIVTTVDLQREFLMNNRHQWGTVKEAVPVDEAKMLSKKLLSMVRQITEKEKLIYSQLKALRCDFEAHTYNYLAVLNYLDDIEEGIAIAYYKKALDIYLQFGIKGEAKAIQTSMDVMRTPSESSKAFMKNAKSVYEYNIEKNGLTSEHTMRFGLEYGELLLKMHHYNEAEKLAMKLAADSRRVHGPDHNCTVRADMLLEKCKNRVSSSSMSYHFLCCFLCPILFCYLCIGCLILFKGIIMGIKRVDFPLHV